MKKTILGLIAIMIMSCQLAYAAAPQAAAAPSNNLAGGIGVVDINKVMAESPKLKAMQEQLNKKGQEITAQLSEVRKTMPPEQFRQKQDVAYEVYIQMKKDFDKNADDAVKLALFQVMKEKNLSHILYKDIVAYGGVDITADVIAKLQ